jgi:hypothetical protein
MDLQVSSRAHREKILSYTMKYESGCLFSSFALINGPWGLDFSGVGLMLACDIAFGLKPRSVGPLNVYFEGWS